MWQAPPRSHVAHAGSQNEASGLLTWHLSASTADSLLINGFFRDVEGIKSVNFYKTVYLPNVGNERQSLCENHE